MGEVEATGLDVGVDEDVERGSVGGDGSEHGIVEGDDGVEAAGLGEGGEDEVEGECGGGGGSEERGGFVELSGVEEGLDVAVDFGMGYGDGEASLLSWKKQQHFRCLIRKKKL